MSLFKVVESVHKLLCLFHGQVELLLADSLLVSVLVDELFGGVARERGLLEFKAS